MPKHRSTVEWNRNGADFANNRYSRGHVWRFDGGAEIPASSSPHIVPIPMSVEAAIDPEEAFVASLSSCHMLWFLSIARERGFLVDSYRDEAEGAMGKNEEGRIAMVRVALHPMAIFSAEVHPTINEILSMHDEAHEKCFIANSVKTEVSCEPVFFQAPL